MTTCHHCGSDHDPDFCLDAPTACNDCGYVLPRGDMFGRDGALVCEPCHRDRLVMSRVL